MGWWVTCPVCKGSGRDPEDEEQDCPHCKDTGKPGRVWRESFL